MENQQLVELTADVVASHVANNTVAVGDVGTLVQRVYDALAALGQKPEEVPQAKQPVVSVRASIKPDYLVCMECGTKHKMLRRHLQSAHGITAEQYRADYGLPAEYPMTAPNYASLRRDLAVASGLGRGGKRKKDGDAGEGSTDTPEEPAAKARGRKKASS